MTAKLADEAPAVPAKVHDQDRPRRTGEHIVAALAASPPGDLKLDRPFVDGPPRGVDP